MQTESHYYAFTELASGPNWTIGAIFMTAKSQIFKTLDTVHNAAVRTCNGAFSNSPIIIFLRETGESSLMQRRDQISLQFYCHIIARHTSLTCTTIRQFPPNLAPSSSVSQRIELLITDFVVPRIMVVHLSRDAVLILRGKSTR